jgi:hypothetical protein
MSNVTAMDVDVIFAKLFLTQFTSSPPIMVMYTRFQAGANIKKTIKIRTQQHPYNFFNNLFPLVIKHLVDNNV